jgi:hypothetical protein
MSLILQTEADACMMGKGGRLFMAGMREEDEAQ